MEIIIQYYRIYFGSGFAVSHTQSGSREQKLSHSMWPMSISVNW